MKPLDSLVNWPSDQLDERKEWEAGLDKIIEALHQPAWEYIAVALCCGEHCNAANLAPDHDMSETRYCEKHGCESEDIYNLANKAVEFLERRNREALRIAERMRGTRR